MFSALLLSAVLGCATPECSCTQAQVEVPCVVMTPRIVYRSPVCYLPAVTYPAWVPPQRMVVTPRIIYRPRRVVIGHPFIY